MIRLFKNFLNYRILKISLGDIYVIWSAGNVIDWNSTDFLNTDRLSMYKAQLFQLEIFAFNRSDNLHESGTHNTLIAL